MPGFGRKLNTTMIVSFQMTESQQRRYKSLIHEWIYFAFKHAYPNLLEDRDVPEKTPYLKLDRQIPMYRDRGEARIFFLSEVHRIGNMPFPLKDLGFRTFQDVADYVYLLPIDGILDEDLLRTEQRVWK